MAYVRTVKTASGAMAVQIVHSSRCGSKDIEHLGSAHDEEELAALKAAARQRQVRSHRTGLSTGSAVVHEGTTVKVGLHLRYPPPGPYGDPVMGHRHSPVRLSALQHPHSATPAAVLRPVSGSPGLRDRS